MVDGPQQAASVLKLAPQRQGVFFPMNIAVFPGTFDPATLGHFDIIQRSSHAALMISGYLMFGACFIGLVLYGVFKYAVFLTISATLWTCCTMAMIFTILKPNASKPKTRTAPAVRFHPPLRQILLTA